MFADIGLGEWLHEFEDMSGEVLTKLVMDMYHHPTSATQKVKQAMAYVHQRQDVTMASVQAALSRR